MTKYLFEASLSWDLAIRRLVHSVPSAESTPSLPQTLSTSRALQLRTSTLISIIKPATACPNYTWMKYTLYPGLTALHS